MRKLFVAVLLAGAVLAIGGAEAADGCGPGCHSTMSGACVVDLWGSVRNECPAGSRPLPPCPYGTRWKHGACIAS
jgi:hypothetical protein